jgi:hypothetical protein
MGRVGTQILNYGGGWQTTGMLELIRQEKLPRPDRIIIADTGREKKSTWRYLENVARPRMAEIGLTIEKAPRSLAYVDLYGHNGDLLLPVYTATGKLNAFCSDEWKGQVVHRYVKLGALGFTPDQVATMPQVIVREQMKRRVDESFVNWIGFTYDERKRIKNTEGRWFPLVEMMITKTDIRSILRTAGWPDPNSSSCWMCANLDNAEWRSIRATDPDDFEEACRIDEEIRETDIFNGGSGVWLHHSRIPLRDANLEDDDRKRGPARQCGLGLCMI